MTEKTPQDPSSVALESTRKKKWPQIVGALLLLLLIIAALIGLLIGQDDEEATKPAASVTTTHSPSATASKATTSLSRRKLLLQRLQQRRRVMKIHVLQSFALRQQIRGTFYMVQKELPILISLKKEWTKTIEDVKNSEAYTFTVAGDTADKSSEVTCQILVDGKVEQEAKGSAAAGEATCVLPAKFL